MNISALFLFLFLASRIYIFLFLDMSLILYREIILEKKAPGPVNGY